MEFSLTFVFYFYLLFYFLKLSIFTSTLLTLYLCYAIQLLATVTNHESLLQELQAHSELCQKSKIECFVTIVNGL